jgi:hypothetical protein
MVEHVEALERFRVQQRVLPELTIENIQRQKIALIAEIGKADSIRDFGGLWGVHGLYLLEGARVLESDFAEMIDVTPVEEFVVNARRLQQERAIQINMIEADFRTPDLFEILRPVDVALLYDVLLHQDTAVEVIKGVTATTRECICVAQPVLKEEIFTLPNAAVNLQFYGEELKDELRTGSWWPKEAPVRRFDQSKWLWGQTASFLRSLFTGYGWRVEYEQAHEMGVYWTYALARFAPDRPTG